MMNSIVRGALTGAVTAAGVDLHAFRTWKNFDDARQYDWKVAAWRWLQGAVYGATAAAGLNLFW